MPRVVVKHPHKEPRVVHWPDMDLENYYSTLDGGTFSSAMVLPGEGHSGRVMCYCDDEGIRKRLPINILRPTDGMPIFGTIFFVGLTGPENRGLTDGEIYFLEAFFRVMYGWTLRGVDNDSRGEGQE